MRVSNRSLWAFVALLAGPLGAWTVHAQAITALGIPADDSAMTPEDLDGPLVRGGSVRGHARQIADQLLQNARNGGITGAAISSGTVQAVNAADGSDPSNTQINDPRLDHIVSFPGVTRPFEFATQSETSAATSGANVVVGYNTSAFQTIQLFPQGLFFTQRFLTGYSVSHDGGHTWRSSFTPPAAGSNFTFGDPVVVTDRHGNFYFVSLGADKSGNTVINVNKSTDHGDTFGTAVSVATDNGGDKNWIAVGPDPAVRERDNVYVTWTSFQGAGSQVWFGRSTDGGATWSTKALFVPVADTLNSAQIQFTNPVVDHDNGRLYIPFLHFSNVDADNIRVLVSDDAGASFHFLAFNVPGAVDAFAFPNVTPGEFVDCGINNGGLRNVLHQGGDIGGGEFGLARYKFATRLITQPAAAVSHGRLLLAFNRSTSPFFGDPTAGSEIRLLASNDGGATWAAPLTVAASTAAAPQHVHPAIALRGEGGAVVGYYVQQADSRLRTESASVTFDDGTPHVAHTAPLSSVAFDLEPSNIPHPLATDAFFTTNFDRSIRACYNIGEYMSVARSGEEGVIAAWGDNRNSWTGPSDSSAPGPHAQADVFVRVSGD